MQFFRIFEDQFKLHRDYTAGRVTGFPAKMEIQERKANWRTERQLIKLQIDIRPM
jgi:hypothetical protein